MLGDGSAAVVPIVFRRQSRSLDNRIPTRSFRKHERNAAEDRVAMNQDRANVGQWDEIREILDDEVNRLPDRLRLPLVLFHFEHRTLAEVAAILGAGVPTVTRSGRACRSPNRESDGGGSIAYDGPVVRAPRALTPRVPYASPIRSTG